MIKPVILCVDDDPEVLNAIERDVRGHYRSAYRVLKAASGDEALAAAEQLKARGTPVALFLVDQRMPGMTGTELLDRLRTLHEDALKVLLTAYADTEAAIVSINRIGLDHYLMKPWDPPEQKLFPVLDDLLAGWTGRARIPYDGIRVAGTQLSSQSYAVKDFLARNLVPYRWVDLDRDGGMRQLVEALPGGGSRLPVVFFPDGTQLVAPGDTELAEKVGLQTKASRPYYDLVIVGSGPAGLANAVYAASEGLRALLVEQHAPGGQAGTSSRIENYLGFPAGVSGADLAQRALAQAKRFGAEILSATEVVELRREDPYRIVRFADGSEVSCRAVSLATGMSVRRLEAEGIERYQGIGVYYGAAMTEGVTYRGQDVCVVGGANSAGQGAMFFSRYARRVTIITRSPVAKSMSRYLADRIEETENIDVLTDVEIDGVCGSERLEKVLLRGCDGGATRELETAAMFIFIGAAPHSAMARGFVELDEQGFILTGEDLLRSGRRPAGWDLDRDPMLFETSVPGVFAIGDVRSGANRRVAAAVGEGSASLYQIHRYLDSV
ncbi:MAG: FAD-dependent oxidoreductase [Ignavibacteria bacterium]|nr:FAD-dependent oxidoreductase [Ignavibacteria bacterium]